MPLKTTIVALLTLFAVTTFIARYEGANTADFYQFWGVTAAQRWTPTLKGPYDNHREYAAALQQRAAQSADDKLKRAAHLRRKRLHLTSTPLLYAVFSHLGTADASYTATWRGYFIAQIVSFAGAVFALIYAYSGAGFLASAMTLTLVLVFVPFRSDLNVGNLGSIQLAAVTILVLGADRPAATQRSRREWATSAAIFCGLVFLTLLKPNLVLFSLTMALHLIAVHGWRSFGLSLAPWGALFAVLLIFWSGATLGGVSVWLDWYDQVYGSNPKSLVFPVSTGNVSTALLLSNNLGISIGTAIVLLAAAVAFSALSAVAAMNAGRGALVRRSHVLFVNSFRDPCFAATVGLSLTFALMPLTWFHYYVLMLMPALWLVAKPDHAIGVRLAGTLAIVFAAGVIQPVGGPLFGWSGVHRYLTALSWVPVWIGIILLLVRSTRLGSAPNSTACDSHPSADAENLG